jgi:hypothetical protein
MAEILASAISIDQRLIREKLKRCSPSDGLASPRRVRPLADVAAVCSAGDTPASTAGSGQLITDNSQKLLFALMVRLLHVCTAGDNNPVRYHLTVEHAGFSADGKSALRTTTIIRR